MTPIAADPTGRARLLDRTGQGYTAGMSEMKTYSKGIFSSDHQEEREHIVELLKQAYWMEVETVINYITTSVNVDGLRAQEIRESPAKDVQEELGHAQQFADRIKKLY